MNAAAASPHFRLAACRCSGTVAVSHHAARPSNGRNAMPISLESCRVLSLVGSRECTECFVSHHSVRTTDNTASPPSCNGPPRNYCCARHYQGVSTHSKRVAQQPMVYVNHEQACVTFKSWLGKGEVRSWKLEAHAFSVFSAMIVFAEAKQIMTGLL